MDMIEKLTKSSGPEEAVERRGKSPEQPFLSQQMAAFAETIQITALPETKNPLSPEELKAKFAEMVERVAELEKKSRTDDLTGLLNRRGFQEEWDGYVSLLKRERSKNIYIPSAFLAIDLDGFKMVNDSTGHDGGDKFLQLAAQKMQDTLRKEDVLARIGGDEFVVFLFDTTADGAKKSAGKIRLAIEEVNGVMRQEYAQYRVNASASIGVVTIDGEGHIGDDKYTTLEQHPTVGEIRNYADYALYVAKDKGKAGEFTLKEAWDADPERKLEAAYRNL